MNFKEKIDFFYILRVMIAKILKLSPNIIVTKTFTNLNAYKTTEFNINLMGLNNICILLY